MLTLVLGGARSGKSRFAASLCRAESTVTYIATAYASDEEMKSRIARHRRERPTHWKTLEEALSPASAVAASCRDSEFVVVDCLTLWLSNLCWQRRQSAVDELEQIASWELDGIAASSVDSNVILVSNEVGCSLVPDSILGRSFQDLQGLINQAAARKAQVVYQMVAGIPAVLKPRNNSMESLS
jgi:adenosylcobinamide kinase/adenosylcobinamide-phosphate guanylyltransferase